ncbi:hypothetical protein SK128_007564 [Halocaridina rubra]|uniref:Uncharacterized protein n=1 Tax=Halocaridina rubra TaxID=373956 RepID=A0AAN8XMZ1_HALRR
MVYHISSQRLLGNTEKSPLRVVYHAQVRDLLGKTSRKGSGVPLYRGKGSGVDFLFTTITADNSEIAVVDGAVIITAATILSLLLLLLVLLLITVTSVTDTGILKNIYHSYRTRREEEKACLLLGNRFEICIKNVSKCLQEPTVYS